MRPQYAARTEELLQPGGLLAGSGAEPALLEHGDVRTFLHELLHRLHHLLGGHWRSARPPRCRSS